jgi:hypothetical protein
MLVQRYVADKRVDEAEARRSLQAFLDKLMPQLDILASVVQAGEFAQIAEQAAGLRSQAAEVCISEVADAAAALELAANDKSEVACTVHFDALRRNSTDVCQNDH